MNNRCQKSDSYILMRIKLNQGLLFWEKGVCMFLSIQNRFSKNYQKFTTHQPPPSWRLWKLSCSRRRNIKNLGAELKLNLRIYLLLVRVKLKVETCISTEKIVMNFRQFSKSCLNFSELHKACSPTPFWEAVAMATRRINTAHRRTVWIGRWPAWVRDVLGILACCLILLNLA